MEAIERNEKIREIISEQLCVDIMKVVGPASWEDIGADSLDVVELVMAIEEYFNCEISEEHAEKLTTVQDCFNYAEENKLSINEGPRLTCAGCGKITDSMVPFCNDCAVSP